MATVKIETFGGIAPRQHPTQLADGMATIAQNVKLESGKLVPLRQPLIVSGAKNIMENGLADPAAAKPPVLGCADDCCGGYDLTVDGKVATNLDKELAERVVAHYNRK